MAVTEEQMDSDGQTEGGRTSITGAGFPSTAALIVPCAFPATNTVINCPGAAATGGYKYPIPTIVFADAPCPNAQEEHAVQKIANFIKRFISLRHPVPQFPDIPGGLLLLLLYSGGARQTPAPSNEYCPPTVRLDWTVAERSSVPVGGCGGMKLTCAPGSPSCKLPETHSARNSVVKRCQTAWPRWPDRSPPRWLHAGARGSARFAGPHRESPTSRRLQKASPDRRASTSLQPPRPARR